MPTERLSMRRIPDLLRLKYAQGLAVNGRLPCRLGLGRARLETTWRGRVRRVYRGRLRRNWTTTAWSCCCFPARAWQRGWIGLLPDWAVPVWALIDRELRRPGVTRALLWEEYRARAPDGFGYAWFCEHFDAWKGRVRQTMRQTMRFQRNAPDACGRRDGVCRFCG